MKRESYKQVFNKKGFRILGIAVLGVLAIVGVFSLIRMAQERPMPYGGTFEDSYESVEKNVPSSPMMAERDMSMEAGFGGVAMNDSVITQEVFPEMENREQEVIQTGSLDLRVTEADRAVEEIKGVTEYYQGQVFSIDLHESVNGIKSGYVTVKVPSDTFYRAIAGLKEVESVVIVLSESMSGQDVTEQYVDLEARLSNKRAEEGAFLEILETADSTDNVIKVTRELSRVRGEIEQIEGQLRYLDSKTDMSTITISLSEDQTVTIVDTWRPLQEVKVAVNDLLESLQGFFSLVIVFFIWFLPMAIVYLLAFGIIFFVGRAFVRRSKGKDKE